MSNDANRTFIVIAAAGWIVFMAVLIFFTWSADTDIIDKIGDFQEYLGAHNDNAGKLIVTLSALVTVVIALLLVIVEIAPEDEERELRVEQAGATTIVPASALRQRLEEALMGIPEVTGAKARVATKDKGITTALDVTLVPGANVASVTQEAVRVVIDAVQTDLGLPVVGTPTVRIAFGTGQKPVASSVSQAPAAAPAEQMEPAASQAETVEQRFESMQPGADAPPETPPPSPWAFEASPPSPPREPPDAENRPGDEEQLP